MRSKAISARQLRKDDVVLMPDVSDDEVRVEHVDTAPAVGPVASVVLRNGTRRRVQLLESVQLLWLGNLSGRPLPGSA
jgi:hypothetical protein